MSDVYHAPLMQRLAAALLGFAALLVWRAIYDLHCLALAIPAAVIAVIAWQVAEYGIARRRCFANCFLPEGSFLYRFLTRRTLIIVLAVLGVLVTGAILMLNILIWNDAILATLATDALLLALVLPTVVRATTARLNPRMGCIAGKNITATLNTLLMLGGLLAIQMHSKLPAYIDPDLSLSITMASASETMNSVCPLIETAARLSAEKEAIGWWLMLETSSRIDNPSFRWGAWMLFFVNSTLSIWAYSRYIVQSVDLASKGRTEEG